MDRAVRIIRKRRLELADQIAGLPVGTAIDFVLTSLEREGHRFHNVLSKGELESVVADAFI